MFSDEIRCVYQNNQLGEVICQLRFPQILSIEANLPAEFQDTIRDQFPLFSQRMEAPAPKISGAPGNLSLENQPKTHNYQFVSEDGVWRVNLTSSFISLSCSKYTCWEDFAEKLDKPLASFIKIYKPAFFERVGLRYLNFISRHTLGLEGAPFAELISPCYLGVLSCEDILETNCTRSSIDTELSIRGGCKAKIHAGPGLVQRNGQKDTEVKFIFDQDLYMPGKVPVNLSAPCLQTLHGQAYSIFRGAVTPMLHNAMEPHEP